jgi:hypothetical protein
VRTGIDIYGRNGKSLDDKWQNHGAATLHGVCSNGFPNLFFAPLGQSSQAANNVFTLEVASEHVAYFIKVAEARAGAGAIVEVTSEAEEAWSMEIMQHAAWFAGVVGCTPGYITSEGERLKQPKDQMEMMKQARGANLSGGMESYLRVLEAYWAEGSLKGMEVTSAA